MAELANAIAFIESNVEELSKEELDLKLVSDFRAKVAELG